MLVWLLFKIIELLFSLGYFMFQLVNLWFRLLYFDFVFGNLLGIIFKLELFLYKSFRVDSLVHVVFLLEHFFDLLQKLLLSLEFFSVFVFGVNVLNLVVFHVHGNNRRLRRWRRRLFFLDFLDFHLFDLLFNAFLQVLLSYRLLLWFCHNNLLCWWSWRSVLALFVSLF